jgi:hypothetical protein
LDEWLEATGHDRGETVPMQTLYDLSRDWYAGRRDEAWMPIDPDGIRAMFARHGLTGPFWAID